MSTVNLPCINSNPDIAGIGVRISVYIQALLNLVCAIIFAKDGWISSYEHTVLITTSTNLFATGCALVVCAFVQAATFGFSVYHGLIVLNLSWIISLSAFLYLIVVTLNFLTTIMMPVRGCGAGAEEEEESKRVPASIRVVFLSVFHLSAVGALGIWLWATVHSFGDQPECTPVTFLTIFGHDVPVTQSSLRHGSLSLYSLAAISFLNIIVIIFAGALVTILLSLAYCGLSIAGMPGEWETFILITGMLVMVLLEVTFIVDTELLISRSSKWVKQGESQWSFGQTLALILVVIPLVETTKAAFKSWKEGNGVRGLRRRN